MKILNFCRLVMCILCTLCMSSVKCLKFRTVSLSELALITREGERFWESLGEKVKLPHYGTCWKEAVQDLQIGCKSLSEDVQSELALRFTDCFLQMSGYEPLICSYSRDVCLRNLSDRAFNAYTEFYTHTQSICYFLQNQVWHEETQKTIEKLSDVSVVVTEQLQEAGEAQKNILDQQKESLILQHNLLDNGKTIASALALSEEKISKIMTDFQNSAVEQKKILFELFEKITLLRSWVVGEMSWVNSVLFYMASMIIGYLLTSASSTKQARTYILISLTINYFIERFIYSYFYEIDHSGEHINSWIWISRKIFIFVSAVVLIYSTLMYCDYNLVNHKLLIEIKNQNKKILNFFESDSIYYNKILRENVNSEIFLPEIHSKSSDTIYSNQYLGRNNISKNYISSPILSASYHREKHVHIDDIDNVSVVSKKSESGGIPAKRETPYNLRSSRQKAK